MAPAYSVKPAYSPVSSDATTVLSINMQRRAYKTFNADGTRTTVLRWRP